MTENKKSENVHNFKSISFYYFKVIESCVPAVWHKKHFGSITLGTEMFYPFWSVWCKMALAEVGMSLP